MNTTTSTTNHSNTNNNSMHSILDRAAELNEDGVYELADGNFNSAVQSFESAVRQMMALYQQRVSATTPPSPQPQHEVLLPCSRSSVEVPFLHDDRFFIYSCTITINPTQPSSVSEGAVPPSPEELAFYCSTILFNMALAHHQQGQKLLMVASPPMADKEQTAAATLQERQRLLRQALMLYQESARALETVFQRTSSSSSPQTCYREDLILLQLATLNNTALIRMDLPEGDQAQTQTSFRELLQASMMVLERVESSNFSIFEQSQLQEFVRNAFVYEGSLLCGGYSCGNMMGGGMAAACA